MTLTVRSATVTDATTKGSALTHAELDENFNHLRQSSNHSFTPSGTGAVARTMQAKAREIVSITDFGATGDGSTDDSSDIQAATDAVKTAGGGIVWSPAATSGYKINTGISISLTADTDVSVTFAGMSDRSRWIAGAAIDMLTVTNTTSNARRVTVKDMMFNLNDTATGGVVFNNCAYDRILDSHFVNGDSADCVRLTGECTGIFISRSYFLHGETNGVGISVEGTTRACHIAGNYFGEGIEWGIKLESGTHDNTVLGNTFFNVDTAAIEASQSDRNIIADNFIRQVNGHGMRFTSSDNNQIKGNVFRDTGNGAGSNYGIFVTTASSTDGIGNVIEGNTFLEGDASHIRIASASGNSIRTVVRNNFFDDSVSSLRVFDAGLGTIREGNINDDFEMVKYVDHFIGDVLADQWGSQVGSDPQVVAPAILAGQIGGVVRMTAGDDAAASMAVNGVQLESGLNWRASQGSLALEARVKISSGTSVSVFVGFTDQIGTLEMPIQSAASADTITTNATDAVGFMFDTAMATDNWWLVGVANDVDATHQDGGVAPTAGAFQVLRVELSTTGVAAFYRNGTQLGTAMTGAVTAGTALTPVIAVFSYTTATKSVDVDYITLQGGCV
jgi:parallel beta-helix repeat protein